jgi:histidinol-phosphate aminotransferase
MSPNKLQSLVRPRIQRLQAYVPGEQPKIKGLIKLNTNENPYPPSPKVLAAVQAAVDSRLRLYPNPSADALREKLARLHGCRVENLIVGNGSDELLALATRTFVEPVAVMSGRLSSRYLLPPPKGTVQFFTPSYSLYPVLAEIHGAATNAVSLKTDFSLPSGTRRRREQQWSIAAALTFITTPNAPTGRGYATAELEALCAEQNGVVVLDEAYADFAEENALPLGLKRPNVLIARTFSKAYSLCFQRVGYFVGHPELIAALHKVRDSYNVNGLGQVAAAATLDDLPYYRANFRRLIAVREQTARELAELGFEVLPSQTNFLLTRPPQFPASEWLQNLREAKILVRWFDQPVIRDYLRITIGTDDEMAALAKATRKILAK